MLFEEDVEIEDLCSVESRHEGHLVERGEEAASSSHLGEGILVNNPQLRITEADLWKLRYLYKIPKAVEVQVMDAHEQVNWIY